MPYKYKEDKAAHQRRYRALHPERTKADNAAYYEKNRDSLRVLRRMNQERDTAYHRVYRATKAGTIKNRVGVWRSKGIDLTWEQFEQMLADQHYRCAICGREINESAHLDHSHKTGHVRGLL